MQKPNAIMSALAAKWRSMSDQEKTPFTALAGQDRERCAPSPAPPPPLDTPTRSSRSTYIAMRRPLTRAAAAPARRQL